MAGPTDNGRLPHILPETIRRIRSLVQSATLTEWNTPDIRFDRNRS